MHSKRTIISIGSRGRSLGARLTVAGRPGYNLLLNIAALVHYSTARHQRERGWLWMIYAAGILLRAKKRIGRENRHCGSADSSTSLGRPTRQLPSGRGGTLPVADRSNKDQPGGARASAVILEGLCAMDLCGGGLPKWTTARGRPFWVYCAVLLCAWVQHWPSLPILFFDLTAGRHSTWGTLNDFFLS